MIQGQTALVTGASSGIGKACAEAFAAQGVHLVITARRMDRLKELAKTLSLEYQVNVTPLQFDVQDRQEVEKNLGKLDQDIDILVNNAGLALTSDKMQDSDVNNWETMIDTNIKGLLYVTHVVLPRMLKKNRGHIINISSIAGHECYPTGNVYCATKHAVRALSKSLRLDLIESNLRVSDVAPGAVETEFSIVRWNDEEKAKQFYKGFTPLVAEDIADAVLYCATRPPHVNVSEMVIYPQRQAGTILHRKIDK